MAIQANGVLSPWLRNKRVAVARPFIKGKVLDVGCGDGFLAQFISPENYLGVDIDGESLQIARQEYPTRRFQANYPQNELFDTIVILAVIEHIIDPLTFLNGLKALLAPKGRFVLTTPHTSMIWAHSFGAKAGIFSKDAYNEHKDIFNYTKMQNILSQANLNILYYRRFLCRANQLFVAEHRI